MDFDERILEMRKRGEALRQAFGYERNLAVPIFEDVPWYDEQEIAALSRKQTEVEQAAPEARPAPWTTCIIWNRSFWRMAYGRKFTPLQAFRTERPAFPLYGMSSGPISISGCRLPMPSCRMSTGIAETMFHAEAYGIY